jgi:hypothetical protein
VIVRPYCLPCLANMFALIGNVRVRLEAAQAWCAHPLR